ncbi:XTP/dITP diphosphatase [Hathewaya limosa]|uniref:dITP/XTP pyrophosphatase n=1 Tax=Hathewaya limosa TaxID=1536 RepID=A0ABU0JU81_HATLI|nr:XTP/dITP diphosphatase [Hathewaya limosa]AWZ47845.1 non-canonical purine NTP pyrophosphatase [Clostridiaceae bacterium 14S0207]MDQ0480663.1 XTP/dITP diphosphohydrolase [Hathewaya limosa]
MKKLILATNNQNKVKEIKTILRDFKFEVRSLKEEGIDVDVEETGNTFMENAYIKAKAIHDMVKDAYVLADDSGLMVDYLNGEPGVYSARYAGEHDDKKNKDKLLKKLEGVPKEQRIAKFVCAMTLILNDEEVIKVQGEVEGYILKEEHGNSGFGYDPLFYVERFKKSFAEVTSEEKNSISHRGIALKKLERELKSRL